ncbi:transcription initiation factor IIA gamma chain [Nannizzia gypsea CBS 118893]|uniref:Transcription initiation factor IIA subunit 2 n=1 Tax=Arthroderma gypseum (strain ATCC MYA-4604 / CBS 118893) TaxID=535722 RepID=E4UVS0_ARTGP|nr:transcription initiation factor IIA gamma chain [Nannizzia gypsea CBS 118893]EFR02397.1 transcription initiation factor IIA gamma chain [Nannizzia gypsea CBS 118893]
MSAPAYYELYRGSSIGLSLTDTLDDLINEGRIEPQLAMKILSNFDRVITEVLADKVKCKLSFKGDTPRLHWRRYLVNITFKTEFEHGSEMLEGIPFPGVWTGNGVCGNFFEEIPRHGNENIMTLLLEIHG